MESGAGQLEQDLLPVILRGPGEGCSDCNSTEQDEYARRMRDPVCGLADGRCDFLQSAIHQNVVRVIDQSTLLHQPCDNACTPI